MSATYKLNDALAGPEGYAKLDAFSKAIPGQARAILLALHEMNAAAGQVNEETLVKYFMADGNLKRLSPGSEKETEKSVSNFVAQYRAPLGRIPGLLTIDVSRAGGVRPRSPDTIVDPITGEAIANPFARKRKEKAKPTAQATTNEGQNQGQAA